MAAYLGLSEFQLWFLVPIVSFGVALLLAFFMNPKRFLTYAVNLVFFMFAGRAMGEN